MLRHHRGETTSALPPSSAWPISYSPDARHGGAQPGAWCLLPVWAAVWVGTAYLLFVRRPAACRRRKVMCWGAGPRLCGVSAGRRTADVGPVGEGCSRPGTVEHRLDPGGRRRPRSCRRGPQFGVQQSRPLLPGPDVGPSSLDVHRRGRPQAVFSTPCVAGGRIYLGEGFHQIRRASSAAWTRRPARNCGNSPPAATSSPPRASPTAAYWGRRRRRVLPGRGDRQAALAFRGDARRYRLRWWNGRVYAGSGYGRLEAFCLDAATGQPVWRAAPAAADVWHTDRHRRVRLPRDRQRRLREQRPTTRRGGAVPRRPHRRRGVEVRRGRRGPRPAAIVGRRLFACSRTELLRP